MDGLDDLALREAIRRSLNDEEAQNETAPEKNTNPRTPECKASATECEPEESFAEDAEGNGEIAAVLGEALDRVARAIDDMNLELSREASGTEDEDDDGDNPEGEIVVEPEDKQGATIVVGEEVDDPSNEEWSVVSDEQPNEHKHDIAQAAQALGSALYESDMSRSHENGAESNTGSFVSSVTSVPTTAPSLAADRSIPEAQIQHWARHLEQLHELGFHDDTVSVDILERLEAANIGADCYDDISVSRVVNELIKDE